MSGSHDVNGQILRSLKMLYRLAPYPKVKFRLNQKKICTNSQIGITEVHKCQDISIEVSSERIVISSVKWESRPAGPAYSQYFISC